ncbi:AP-3 complex subunit mu-like isoform X2 [Chenopodium quinoa]|uniref:AP-3 complex subunit mu-like isoform X2 n=1 Tax=Chenopodium quinoa TaxID=63459 RepID=UPI000B79A8FB|nr:AP-3 complex subunit mu-like isoform X2 [Chenopodium quinoa]
MELTFKSCKHQVGAAHYIAFAENYSTIFKSDIYTDNEHAYQGLDLTANHGTVDILANKVAEFRIMGIALSGLKIDKLEVSNVENRPFKGFKALTRAWEYQVRS